MLDENVYLKKLIARKQEKVNSYIELTKAINNNFSRAALYKLLEFTLERNFQIQKMALFVNEGEWKLEINKGNEEIANKIDVKEDSIKFHVIQDIKRYKGSHFEGFDYLIPVVHKKSPLAYLLISEMKLEELDSIDENLKYIESICSFILTSIENKRLFKEQLEKNRISKEVELASQVQNMLIPSVLPKDENIEAAAFYKPHGSIGGDYYDLISIDDNTVVFCMCDVSGKGIAAGMIMANFQAQLRAMVVKYDSLEQIVDYLNFKLFEITQGDKFITMFLGRYDYETRNLEYVTAGHNISYLIQNDEIIELKKGSTLLGAFDNLPKIEVGREQIDENGVLFTYTDGLTEQENELKQMYGEENLVKFLLNNDKTDMQELVENLQIEISKYKGELPYGDDVSVLAMKFL
ncbi:MAG: PP2C family protein-serine/threonine phosphatase [Bacteroidetes bacterium]|nr:PP2C family protein-serine/threonine phosphatase [Bacteroidota bacterium]MCB9227534.1 PP2C family protein-serine/threonine phosphatase [Chitinophagales bacterium]